MNSLKKGTKIENLQHPIKFQISKFALNQMKKYGWKNGQSLGKSNSGIKSPILPNFRHPKNKNGVGNDKFYDNSESDDDFISLNNYYILKKLNKPKFYNF